MLGGCPWGLLFATLFLRGEKFFERLTFLGKRASLLKKMSSMIDMDFYSGRVVQVSRRLSELDENSPFIEEELQCINGGSSQLFIFFQQFILF